MRWKGTPKRFPSGSSISDAQSFCANRFHPLPPPIVQRSTPLNAKGVIAHENADTNLLYASYRKYCHRFLVFFVQLFYFIQNISYFSFFVLVFSTLFSTKINEKRKIKRLRWPGLHETAERNGRNVYLFYMIFTVLTMWILSSSLCGIWGWWQFATLERYATHFYSYPFGIFHPSSSVHVFCQRTGFIVRATNTLARAAGLSSEPSLRLPAELIPIWWWERVNE